MTAAFSSMNGALPGIRCEMIFTAGDATSSGFRSLTTIPVALPLTEKFSGFRS